MSRHPTPGELRTIPQFSDLPEDQLLWFAERSTVHELDADQVLFTEGDRAEWMYLILEGELHGKRRSAAPDERPYIVVTGDVAGRLPFSRMTHWGGTGRTIHPSRIVAFPAAEFGELVKRMPGLTPRLVQVMADRVRENTRSDLQRDKLLALGRLSAGLAHELNNPASAARRAASGLGKALRDVWERTAPLAAALGAESMQPLAECMQSLAPLQGEPPLARSDREDRIADWLQSAGVEQPWEWAATFAEAGGDVEWLDEVREEVPAESLGVVLAWSEATLRAQQLTMLVESSAERISSLVGAVKSYTFMDRGGDSGAVDVHAGLDSTVLMLAHKLKGVTVERDYSPQLPPIRANGSELNQLWTNLIDNAADAVDGKGTIRITTRPQGDEVCIEIADSGKGIPEELQEQIWEPFFTTKRIGQGTGLGLDITRRIVNAHHGHIRVKSEPGSTRFTVLLPVEGASRGGSRDAAS